MPPSLLDRAVLDREYDNVGKVSAEFFQNHVAQLEQRSLEARQQLHTELDICYGSGPLERLDIFLSSIVGADVHIFFHGGYWHALDKNQFSYVANGLLPHGVTTVIVNYPLLPVVDMGAQIAACRRAVRWVYDNIDSYGGNPEKISLSGHSAGGHLLAMMLTLDAEFYRMPALRSVHLISGIYDLAPIQKSFVNDTIVLTSEDIRLYSPVHLQRQVVCPVHIMVGGDEGQAYLQQSKKLFSAWNSTDSIVTMQILDAANHFSMRAQLGNANSEIVKHICAGFAETKLTKTWNRF